MFKNLKCIWQNKIHYIRTSKIDQLHNVIATQRSNLYYCFIICSSFPVILTYYEKIDYINHKTLRLELIHLCSASVIFMITEFWFNASYVYENKVAFETNEQRNKRFQFPFRK